MFPLYAGIDKLIGICIWLSYTRVFEKACSDRMAHGPT